MGRGAAHHLHVSPRRSRPTCYTATACLVGTDDHRSPGVGIVIRRRPGRPHRPPSPAWGEGERRAFRGRARPRKAHSTPGRRMVMRVLNTRFALGLGLFAVIFAVADTAQAGPLRNWRARRAGAAYGAPGAYASAGYGTYGTTAYGYGGAASPCCPQTTGAYDGAMLMPSAYGIQPGGAPGSTSYYTPGATPAPMPAPLPGTVPTPLPGQSDAATTTPATKTVSIGINDSGFEPKTTTVEAGTTVKWTNNGQKPHTVTSDKGDW